MEKMNIALLLILCLSFPGCGLVGEVMMKSLKGPDPEIQRQKEETKRYETATDKINQANTPEKVKAQEETFKVVSEQSHPSLWSSIVSVVHTEEGRRLAGVAMVALVSMIALGLRVASTWGLSGALASTVKGIQDFKNKYDKDNPIRVDLNAALANRHSGIKVNMAKKVKKILGEV